MLARLKSVLASTTALSFVTTGGIALAQSPEAPSIMAGIDPLLAAAVGAVGLAIAAVLWSIRVSATARTQTVAWSRRLSEMEAKLEKTEAVLSAHSGLVLVWDDDQEELESGWGDPKILGGPAALASLLSFDLRSIGEAEKPANRLLELLSKFPIEDDNSSDEDDTFGNKVKALRAHGVAFSGSIFTADGRAIQADGRLAGGQAALWLTDPAVRMAEDGSFVGAVRERAADLHSSHTLLDRAPIPAWRRDAQLNLIWVNQAFVNAVEAESATDVLKGQIELEGAAKKVAEKAASTQSMSDGRVIVNVRGERRVMKIIELPMRASGEASLGGVAIDTTSLDKAKVELKQHVAANRSTLDQIPSAVALFGPSQELSYYNAAFKALWSLDDATLRGPVFHGEILDELQQAGKLPEFPDYKGWRQEQLGLYTDRLSDAGADREGNAPDQIWNLPEGKMLKVSRTRHPLGGVLVVFEDVTEKMTLEANFNTQIRVQEATLNNLSEAVAVFAGDGSLRLLNESFIKLWRLNKGAFEGQPHIDQVFKSLSQKAVEATEQFRNLKNCVTSMSPDARLPIENEFMSLLDGRTFAYGSEPLPDGATLIRFLDVTDSMEREKELKERNAILENADRLKSKFVDHISYHLRTPLSTIIGFSEMLDGQMFGVLNDRQKEYIASVLTASYHLRDLINDIIDLAAIDAGKLELQREETDIRALLENAATYAALKAEDTQVALKVECDKDIGAGNIDQRRIKQVLFNLLSNAFAYSSEGGQISIGAEKVGGMLRIWVQDSGRGISPDDQAKAFDAFESRGPSAGAGLGLSLVERFIKLHGGWVKLDSQEGEGARVTCIIPEQSAEAPSTTPAPRVESQAVETPAQKPKKAKATRTRKKRTTKRETPATRDVEVAK